MTASPISLAIIASLFLTMVESVSFQSLYDRELKSSYGFEIMKHYHSEDFGDNDVKHFKGESMLFMTPWYLLTDSGAKTVSKPHLST